MPAIQAAEGYDPLYVQRSPSPIDPAVTRAEAFDVLIVGAGLSGIGAAWHLQRRHPAKRFAILEARDAIGGTWDLFRYPGIRSDSDMYTLGYPFRPWPGSQSIADGAAIREYIQETAAESGIDRKIRFGHRVVRASWSSADARWTLDIRTHTGEEVRLTCAFLYMCSGYYAYERGYTPQIPGLDHFRGPVVHPQAWPEALDHTGKRIVVIGSGATAVTLVPALACDGAHVTMLQRSPTYIVARPSRDPLSERLQRLLPDRLAYHIIRWRNVVFGLGFYQLARKRPSFIRRLILKGVRKHLGAEHFKPEDFDPPYDPWDQRLCLVPDADLFRAIRSGRASVITDTIDHVTESGVVLSSGRLLQADLIVTATGLEMQLMGGADLLVDGEPVDLSRAMNYRGTMFTGVPNLAYAFGYTNASWTLKCDLSARYVCRLLAFMDENGYVRCVARRREDVDEEPVIDFSSGYVQRALPRLPKQGNRKPYRLNQNYLLDLLEFQLSRIDDGVLDFARNGEAVTRENGAYRKGEAGVR